MTEVNREEFLGTLESVKAGLSSREVLEQSSCFVFQEGRLVSFNDELCCQCPTKLDFTGAVQAKPLIAVLQKMPEEMVRVEASDDHLIVYGKKRQAGVRMEAQIHLPVSQLEKPEEWKELPEEYCDALAMVEKCAGKDLTQFATACVHLHPKWMEAFDNYQMMRYKMKTGVESSTLVKRDSVSHVVGMGATHFSETPSWIHYKNPSGLVISCRRFVENLPYDLGPNTKIDGQSVKLPKGLSSTSECAEIFSAENIDNNQVTVEIKPGKLRVVGRGVSGWYKEVKDIKYDGPSLSFLISPKLLKQITENYNECIVSADRLKVDGGKWCYVAVLGATDSKGD